MSCIRYFGSLTRRLINKKQKRKRHTNTSDVMCKKTTYKHIRCNVQETHIKTTDTTGCYIYKQDAKTELKIKRRKDMSELDTCVRRIMQREPRAIFDRGMLEGLVYERALGPERSRRLSLRFCRDNFRRLCLPSPHAIGEAARRVVHTWQEE